MRNRYTTLRFEGIAYKKAENVHIHFFRRLFCVIERKFL